MEARKVSFGVALAAAAFTLAVAIWVRNPGLYILSGLSVATAYGIWRGGRRGQ